MKNINKNSPDYRAWKKRQNSRKLSRRTRKKKERKRAVMPRSTYIDKRKDVTHKTIAPGHTFNAPIDFSFIHNPEETCSFFNEIITFITDRKNYGKPVFIDVENIESFSIDALMYLLAVIHDMHGGVNKTIFSGNEPLNDKVKRAFAESGFYQYVSYHGSTQLTKNKDNLQIVSGRNSDPQVAKQITDFVCSKAGVAEKSCSFLYIMMIELMSNTHKHAYNSMTPLAPHWYCFSEFDGKHTVSFTFMDTGEGIPATVRKNIVEKIDFLKLKDDGKYVISALNGDFRTATQLSYRGKGLPKIRRFCEEKKIYNMCIITNRAEVIVSQKSMQSKNLNNPLLGTLYYWQIDLAELKGDAI
jgi:hypothetical protein